MTVAIGDVCLLSVPECVPVRTGEDVLELVDSHASPFIGSNTLSDRPRGQLPPLGTSVRPSQAGADHTA